MTVIELYGGHKQLLKKNILIFKLFCKRWNIQELIVGRRLKGDFYIYAISPLNILSLYVTSEAYPLILADLKTEFLLLECDNFFSLPLEDRSLFLNDDVDKLKELLHKSYLIECPQCQRPIEFGKFCQYCGRKLEKNVKSCPTCKLVYVPPYQFCPQCGDRLVAMSHDIENFWTPRDFFYGVDTCCIVTDDSDKDEESTE